MDDEDKDIDTLLDCVFQSADKPYFLEWFRSFNKSCTDDEVRQMAKQQINNSLQDPEKNLIKKLLSDKPGCRSTDTEFREKRVVQCFVRAMKKLPYWQTLIEQWEDEFIDELLKTVADINNDLLLEWYTCFNDVDGEPQQQAKSDIKETLRNKKSQSDPKTNFIIKLMSDGENGYKDNSGVCEKRGCLAELFLHAMKQRYYWIECIENTDRASSAIEIEDSHIISRVKTSCMSLEQIQRRFRQRNTEISLHEAARLEDVAEVKRITEAEHEMETDDDGCTPLHHAAMAIYPNAEIARMIVEAMRSNGNRGMINLRSKRDSGRNTALHVAAGNVSVTRAFIKALKDADPVVFNMEGHTPFHVAAKSQNQNVIIYMLDTFAPTNNRWDVDNVDDHELVSSVNRLINICAINGNAEAVSLLIQHGADISRGVLHEIVRESVICPQKLDKLVKVYHSIVDNAVTWRCLHVEGSCASPPLKDSKKYKCMLRDTMIWLLTNPLEEYGTDVLEHAILDGASTMFQQIVKTDWVFRHVNAFTVRFDVTNFTTETTLKEDADSRSDAKAHATQPVMSEEKKQLTSGLDSFNTVRPQIDFAKRGTPRMPYLTRLLCRFDRWKSSSVLSTEPLNPLTKPYFALVQRFYLLVGLLQLVFMVLFSVYYLPDACSLSLMFNMNITHCSISNSSEFMPDKDVRNTATSSITTRHPSSLWLIWPTILIIGSVVGSYYEHFKTEVAKCNVDRLASKLFKCFQQSVLLISFCCAVFAWYYEFRTSATHKTYVEVTAFVLLLGWITDLEFFGAVSKNFSISALVVKEIIAKDIPSFMLFFVFTVVGFSFAMHALRMSACGLNFIDWHDTIYGVLSSAFGIGDFFETAISDPSCIGVGTKHLFETVYFAYVCVTLIILLNVLIAMMNSRYDLAKQRAENIWRYRILSTMTALESQKCLTNLMEKCRILDLWRPRVDYTAGSYETWRNKMCYLGCCYHDRYKGYIKLRGKNEENEENGPLKNTPAYLLCLDQYG